MAAFIADYDLPQTIGLLPKEKQMGKVLFGLLIVAIVWLLFFAKRKTGRQSNADSNKQMPASERMVSCQRCGVNIPESEAKQVGDGSFTCKNVSACSSAAK